MSFVEEVRRHYAQLGEDWFRQNNHHGDPEQFDSFLHVEEAARRIEESVALAIDTISGANGVDAFSRSRDCRELVSGVDPLLSALAAVTASGRSGAEARLVSLARPCRR